MRDVSSMGKHSVTDDSLFLSVELDFPKLMSPDWKYSVSDIIEKQPRHKYTRNEDDFQIHGNRHVNQQLFRFFPETGLILSDRHPEVALNVVDEFMQLVEKKSIPSNWRWKIKKSIFGSLHDLKHSNFEIKHILIDKIGTNTNLTSSTHVTVNDIQPHFVNEITLSKDGAEANSQDIVIEKENILETNTEQRADENVSSKKKNTTTWIFISVIVVLIIMALFVKIGCFPSYSSVELNSQTEELAETPTLNTDN